MVRLAKDCQSSSLRSVFVLSSHWVRRFFIDLPVSNLYTIFRFFLPCPSQGLKVFSSTISIWLYDLSVFLLHFLTEFWRFFINWSFFGFPPQSPIIGLESFSPATWSSFEIHQFPYGARMFSLVSRFSFVVSHHWVKKFFTRSPFKFPFNGSTLSGACVWRKRQF